MEFLNCHSCKTKLTPVLFFGVEFVHIIQLLALSVSQTKSHLRILTKKIIQRIVPIIRN